ncbi:MAG: hypothetical protein OHK0057_06720 [Thermoflexibacter sp.]
MVITDKVNEINKLVLMLLPEEQEALLKALKKQLLLSKAEQLNLSIKPNIIKIQEIVEEVRKVRIKKHE